MTSKEIALLAAKALDSKKGQNIKCLETGHLTTLADYFVLCTATSTTQIKALADVCEKMLKDAGEPPHHVEGHRGGIWVLLDFSSVVVHIFNEEARQFYDLERLWSDATPVDLSEVLTEIGIVKGRPVKAGRPFTICLSFCPSDGGTAKSRQRKHGAYRSSIG